MNDNDRATASLLLKDASIVDIFWGAGFVVANWLYFALTPGGFFTRKWVISVLVTIWGLRLSLRILLRNWGKPEDFRYRKWREEAGENWWWQSYYRVFLLQGCLVCVISAPGPASAQRAQRRVERAARVGYARVARVGWRAARGARFGASGRPRLRAWRTPPSDSARDRHAGRYRYSSSGAPWIRCGSFLRRDRG